MARNGYPNPSDCLFVAQLDLWNIIQAHNSTKPADQGWATDPQGLTGCLESLANPSGVHWRERDDANRNNLLFSILYSMNKRDYPCPVLINRGGHWVVIVGYETDVAPLDGSTPTLQSIVYQDPEPHNIGTHTTQTAAQWFAGPWNGPVTYNGTWQNQYVAVIESPVRKGRVKVKPVKRGGRRLISPAEAIKRAKRSIADQKLGELPAYSLLAHPEVESLQAFAVHEISPGSRGQAAPAYYVVPFGFKHERSERGTALARAVVLVNGYSGDFQEVTVFGRPVRYLPQAEAITIVAAALQVHPRDLDEAEARLVFQPSDITHIRAFPFWQVSAKRRLFYVDQLGKLYGKLLPSIPGD
jgi:hypothetical protein